MTLKKLVPAILAVSALAGCASQSKPEGTPLQPQTPAQQAQTRPADPKVEFDTRKEVAYRCGDKKEPLTAMYGIRNNGDVVVAQVKFRGNISNVLIRTTENRANVFFSNDSGTGWSTQTANAANLTKVNGIELVQRMTQNVNGKPQQGLAIITNNCVLDKAATAKLNKK